MKSIFHWTLKWQIPSYLPNHSLVSIVCIFTCWWIGIYGPAISVSKHCMRIVCVYLKGFISCCFSFSCSPMDTCSKYTSQSIFNRFYQLIKYIFYRQHNPAYKTQRHQLLFLCLSVSVPTSPIPSCMLRPDKATCTFRLTSVMAIKHHFICI